MRFRNSLVLSAFVILISSLFSTSPLAAAQGTGPEMIIDVDMTVSGLSSLDCSGHVTLTIAGQAAQELRYHIASSFDSDANQYLDVTEAKRFMNGVSQAVVGRIYWGMSITSSTNFSSLLDARVADQTSGVINTVLDSLVDLTFSFDFEGSASSEDRAIEPAQSAYDTFVQSLSSGTGYLFNGTLIVHHKTTYFGLGSYTQPDLSDGKLSSIRTPAGTIVRYSLEADTGLGTDFNDTLRYQDFSIMENQQISFVVLLVGCYMVFRIPGRQFDKFEKLHPRKFRKFAKPLISVRLASILWIALLCVLYLFPFAFSWISVNAMFYAAYLFFLAPLAVVGEYYFGKFMYDRATLKIPDESIVEIKQARVEPAEEEGEILCKVCYTPIEAGLDLFRCTCGLTMHVGCAEKSKTCPSCGEVLFAQHSRSIQCRACGESFMYSGSEDAYSIQCTKCGAFQEDIKPGKNYLVVDEDPRNAFMMIRAMAKMDRPTMCLTSQFPGKIRADYDLGDVQIKWFSDSTTDIDNINPMDLEGAPMEVVSTFLMTTKSAGVLLDGVDVLIEANGFDKLFAFIKRLNDLASIHGSTIILYLNKKSLPDDKFQKISGQYDEVHDYQ